MILKKKGEVTWFSFSDNNEKLQQAIFGVSFHSFLWFSFFQTFTISCPKRIIVQAAYPMVYKSPWRINSAAPSDVRAKRSLVAIKGKLRSAFKEERLDDGWVRPRGEHWGTARVLGESFRKREREVWRGWTARKERNQRGSDG